MQALVILVVDHNVILNCQKTIDIEDGVADENVTFYYSLVASVGTTNTWINEDNCITNDDARVSIISSAGQGGRMVWRFNTIDTTSLNADNQHFDMHGTWVGDNRGSPLGEFYWNTVRTHDGYKQFLDQRGGMGLVFSNKIITSTTDISTDMREEDTDAYPTIGQVTNSFYWGNTYGSTTGLENALPVLVSTGTNTYIKEFREFWKSPPNATNGNPVGVWQNYVPLVYPHPLVTAQDGTPAAPATVSTIGTMRVGTLRQF